MKKLIIPIVACFLLVGCGNKNNKYIGDGTTYAGGGTYSSVRRVLFMPDGTGWAEERGTGGAEYHFVYKLKDETHISFPKGGSSTEHYDGVFSMEYSRRTLTINENTILTAVEY